MYSREQMEEFANGFAQHSEAAMMIKQLLAEKTPKAIAIGYEYLTHKFFDKDIEYAMIGPGTIELGIDVEQSAILLNKEDVEALARHFGIIR